MTLWISINLFSFTDFVGDTQTRYDIGWAALAQNYLMLIVNMTLAIYCSIRESMLHLKIWKLYQTKIKGKKFETN